MAERSDPTAVQARTNQIAWFRQPLEDGRPEIAGVRARLRSAITGVDVT
jgi:hypothetical protein